MSGRLVLVGSWQVLHSVIVPAGVPTAYLGTPVTLRLVKAANEYRLVVNGVVQASLTNDALGAAPMRPYLGTEACAETAAGNVLSYVDRIEVLLDRDGDGLPARLPEQAARAGAVRAGDARYASPAVGWRRRRSTRSSAT